MTGSGDEAADTPVPRPQGVPYEHSSSQPVSEWSAAVYEELKDWAVERAGRWEFWQPDYLLLTIDAVQGAAIEPVLIDTCEGELTITFGYWEAHLPSDGLHDDTDSYRAAVGAKELAESWFEGRIATAIYFSTADKWCGSKALDEPVDRQALADIAWISDFAPSRVEVRKAQKADWRHFRILDGELSDAS